MIFTLFGGQRVNAYYVASAEDTIWNKTEPGRGYGLYK